MSHHLEYSKLWVQNSDPTIETYQGFIETYRDPHGVRAEMEAFVAAVNPETSKILEKLLEPQTAQKLLGMLPVPAYLHRETFVPPTYKAIEIIAFVCCGMPIGINIPNYDQIRNGFGYKNVSLVNVIAARSSKAKDLQYISPELGERIIHQQRVCTDAEVALHELFGHGSCKTILKSEFEKLQPQEQKLLKNFYEEKDTFYGKFGSLQSSFEECRAEVTAHLLISEQIVHQIFNIPAKDEKDFMLCSVYSMALAGILGTMQYDPVSGKWLQAHSQANHCILRNVLQKTDCVKIEFVKGELMIQIDESKIAEVKKAHQWLVQQLNIIKSGAQVEEGFKLFEEMTGMNAEWLKFREFAVKNKKPRSVMLPGRLVKKENAWNILNDNGEAWECAENYVWNLEQAGL